MARAPGVDQPARRSRPALLTRPWPCRSCTIRLRRADARRPSLSDGQVRPADGVSSGEDVVAPAQVRVPELAPPEWLALAHAGEYVSAVLARRWMPPRCAGSAADHARGRARARAATAGTVLTARLALEHGLACNTAGGSHHAFPGYGSDFACSTTSRWPRGCCWPRAWPGASWWSISTSIRATVPRRFSRAIRACSRFRCTAGPISRCASRRATSTCARCRPRG